MHPQTDPAQPVAGNPGTGEPGEPAARFSPEDGDADPRTGIERAVAALADLDALPLAEHVARFEDAHGALTVALSSIDRV